MSEATFAAAALCRHVAGLLAALGAREADAAGVAEALVDADLCGHRSHGVRQLPYYAGQVARGEIDVTAEPQIVADTGVLVTVDGRRGFGHVVARQMAELVAERAQAGRIGAVAVRNANHIGRVGAWTELLAARGLIGVLLVSAQGADQQIAPFGGIDRRLSNNPLSIAVPGPEFPITLDIALSEAAESRVLHAADLGVPVPAGWLLDSEGSPSTDPADYLRGGSLLPVGAAAGSHKGYSLIVACEVLVGLLTGAALCGPEQPSFSNAFVLLALDPGEAGSSRAAEVAALLDWIKSSRVRGGASGGVVGGGEILVPGELEARRRRAADGVVALDSVTISQLDDLAQRLGVSERLGASRGVTA